MDAGDANVEVVLMILLAILDDERVVTLAALRVREASTRAIGGARGRGDDGGNPPRWTRETLT